MPPELQHHHQQQQTPPYQQQGSSRAPASLELLEAHSPHGSEEHPQHVASEITALLHTVSEPPIHTRSSASSSSGSSGPLHLADTTSQQPGSDTPRICRICLQEADASEALCTALTGPHGQPDPTDPLISPCACKGTSRWVHRLCLRTWRKTGRGAASVQCPVCNNHYDREALATVSCSSTGSAGSHDRPSTSSRLAAMALLSLEHRLAATARMSQRGQDAAQLSHSRALADDLAAVDIHAPPPPSWVQSIFGPLGVLMFIALIVGWIRGETDILVWLRGSFLTVVATCCTPFAIVHFALPLAIDVAASSMGGRHSDYALVEPPLVATAWLLTVAIITTVYLLPLAVGEAEATPFRALVAGTTFPATCFNHYRVVKLRRDQWDEQRRAQVQALEAQGGMDSDQLQLWQQRLQQQQPPGGEGPEQQQQQQQGAGQGQGQPAGSDGSRAETGLGSAVLEVLNPLSAGEREQGLGASAAAGPSPGQSRAGPVAGDEESGALGAQEPGVAGVGPGVAVQGPGAEAGRRAAPPGASLAGAAALLTLLQQRTLLEQMRRRLDQAPPAPHREYWGQATAAAAAAAAGASEEGGQGSLPMHQQPQQLQQQRGGSENSEPEARPLLGLNR